MEFVINHQRIAAQQNHQAPALNGPAFEHRTSLPQRPSPHLWQPQLSVEWNPFPIQDKSDFELVEEILSHGGEKVVQLFSFLRQFRHHDKLPLFKSWISPKAVKHISCRGGKRTRKAMEFNLFKVFYFAWKDTGAELVNAAISAFVAKSSLKRTAVKVVAKNGKKRPAPVPTLPPFASFSTSIPTTIAQY